MTTSHGPGDGLTARALTSGHAWKSEEQPGPEPLRRERSGGGSPVTAAERERTAGGRGPDGTGTVSARRTLGHPSATDTGAGGGVGQEGQAADNARTSTTSTTMSSTSTTPMNVV